VYRIVETLCVKAEVTKYVFSLGRTLGDSRRGVRGVGFEPTKAYATGSPRSPVISRDHLSLAPSDLKFARSCPLDLVPA
jgi:hypothetical protein